MRAYRPVASHLSPGNTRDADRSRTGAGIQHHRRFACAPPAREIHPLGFKTSSGVHIKSPGWAA